MRVGSLAAEGAAAPGADAALFSFFVQPCITGSAAMSAKPAIKGTDIAFLSTDIGRFSFFSVASSVGMLPAYRYRPLSTRSWRGEGWPKAGVRRHLTPPPPR